ncbi:hypothetical protein AB1Y20_000978 [Prymnesium parvum]|uniref:Uncharacterized protein n=1 Tax=Prymnesium parvum TaxID=97485 RepID=A0AB34KBA2_PRYPA
MLGAPVLARYHGKKEYPGTIAVDNGDGTFAVSYDDGDYEQAVPAASIRKAALKAWWACASCPARSPPHTRRCSGCGARQPVDDGDAAACKEPSRFLLTQLPASASIPSAPASIPSLSPTSEQTTKSAKSAGSSPRAARGSRVDDAALLGRHVGVPVAFFGVDNDRARYLGQVVALHPRGVWLRYSGCPGYRNWVSAREATEWLVSDEEAADASLWHIDPSSGEDDEVECPAEDEPEELRRETVAAPPHCCRECGKQCGNAGGLTLHMKKRHDMDAEEPAPALRTPPDPLLVTEMLAHLEQTPIRFSKVASLLGVDSETLQGWLDARVLSDASLNAKVRAYLLSARPADKGAAAAAAAAAAGEEHPPSPDATGGEPHVEEARDSSRKTRQKAVAMYDEEALKLVAQLTEHMKATGLSQAKVAEEAHVSSGGRLSAWLNLQLASADSREAVQGKVRAYLAREELKAKRRREAGPLHAKLSVGKPRTAVHLQLALAAGQPRSPRGPASEPTSPSEATGLSSDAAERQQLGARLAAVMKEGGISQATAAEVLGLSGGQRLSEWLRVAESGRPPLQKAKRFRSLDAQVRALLDEPDVPSVVRKMKHGTTHVTARCVSTRDIRGRGRVKLELTTAAGAPKPGVRRAATDAAAEAEAGSRLRHRPRDGAWEDTPVKRPRRHEAPPCGLADGVSRGGAGRLDDVWSGSRAEILLAERHAGGRRQFLVRWQHFGPEHDTWEDEATIVDRQLVRSFDAARHPPRAPKRPRASRLGDSGARHDYLPLPGSRERGICVGERHQVSRLPEKLTFAACREARLCRCLRPAVWKLGRWWCAEAGTGAGCTYEMRPPPSTPPLCYCGEPAVWLRKYFFCEAERCSFEYEPQEQQQPVRMTQSSIEQQMARSCAAFLTAAAYGPMNEWSFVGPCERGLGLYARVPLSPGQFVGEYGGPRLPSEHVRNMDYVLVIPGTKIFIDGDCENSPFECPRYPVIFANHSAVAPNARLEVWPVLQPGKHDLREHVVLVATTHIRPGEEIRFDYEASNGSTSPRAEESVAWRSVRINPPPPALGEPIIDRLAELRAAAAARQEVPTMCPELLQREEPTRWEGDAGGDARLSAIVPLLQREVSGSSVWAIASSHVPGRSGQECYARWLELHGSTSALATKTEEAVSVGQ